MVGLDNIIIWAIVANWGGCLVISWIYVLWLWLISKDIKFEGWVIWRKIVPIARFRLISTKSWYAKLWKKWYGFAMMLAMIHRDEKGPEDDLAVERVIVHETHHVVAQILPMGVLFWIVYLAHSWILSLFTDLNSYRNNIFEVRANAATLRWMRKGRPKVLNFGTRR